ncbi:metallophosphoesterase family protein [Bacillus sp. Marseille-P3661]|uniref:metallophosphoesterase family protein n=1 Tax=Bacillus sp. Marseille-P3661 TaxID=1936234 RepID=UPI000C824EAC|nr:metallophosphoesterase [Bacillus sp. Marseille-P3661]
MKICVMGDTHIPKRAKHFPQKLIEYLQMVDLIIHVGDWLKLDVYDELVKYAPVEGVYGNVDGDDIKSKFPAKKILHLMDYKIGIVHGHGKGKTTEKRALEAFQEDDVDIIIFGHSHIPLMKKMGDLLLFNPGSPTDKRKQPEYSFGLITINEEITAEHVFFSKLT